jgi:hypothetical protein
LPARDEAPLILGHRRDTAARGFDRHYCIIPRVRGLLQ